MTIFSYAFHRTSHNKRSILHLAELLIAERYASCKSIFIASIVDLKVDHNDLWGAYTFKPSFLSNGYGYQPYFLASMVYFAFPFISIMYKNISLNTIYYCSHAFSLMIFTFSIMYMA